MTLFAFILGMTTKAMGITVVKRRGGKSKDLEVFQQAIKSEVELMVANNQSN